MSVFDDQAKDDLLGWVNFLQAEHNLSNLEVIQLVIAILAYLSEYYLDEN